MYARGHISSTSLLCRHPDSCTHKWQCRGWFPPLLHPPFLPPMHTILHFENPSPMSDALLFRPLPVRPPPYGHVTHHLQKRHSGQPSFAALTTAHYRAPCRRGAQAAGSGHGGAPFRTPRTHGRLDTSMPRADPTGRDQRSPSHGHPTLTARQGTDGLRSFTRALKIRTTDGKEHSSEYKSRHNSYSAEVQQPH
jgi:hypothetical protein